MSTQPNIAIIQFPGSNCELETIQAVQRNGMQATEILWNQALDPTTFDGFIIIGGFSYEDRGRSGLIAAKAPILQSLKQAAQQGKPIMGICNGAQILVESGLVPGIIDNNDYCLGAALTHNKRIANGKILGTGFYNDWCYIKPMPSQQHPVFGQHCDNPIHINLAHAEGRFVLDPAVLTALKASGASLWQYCDANGNIDSHFPTNPNGSVDNLAAIANPAGNVLAIMPHPERSASGDCLFSSMRDYIEKQEPVKPQPLNLTLPTPTIEPYSAPPNSKTYITSLTIHDNAAISVEHVAQQLGLPIRMTRYQHWAVQAPSWSIEDEAKLMASAELFNPSKEQLVQVDELSNGTTWHIHEPDNLIGRQKCQHLNNQCQLPHIQEVIHSTLWHITTTDGQPIDDATAQQVLKHALCANPFAAKLTTLFADT